MVKIGILKLELKYHILCKNGSEGCYDLPQEKSLCPSCEYEKDLENQKWIKEELARRNFDEEEFKRKRYGEEE